MGAASGGGPVLKNEFIYEMASFPSCHASTIEDTPSGLVAAWFGGSDEGNSDVGIWVSRHDGERWSTPVEVANGVSEDGRKRHPTWNPVLFHERKSHEIILYYKIGVNPQSWSGFFRRSKDFGKTWGESYIMPAGLLGPIKNKPIQLEDGAVLSPTSIESYKNWACWVDRSVDGCRNWTRHGPIYHPKN